VSEKFLKPPVMSSESFQFHVLFLKGRTPKIVRRTGM
jgi:hypothetical protein